LLLEYDRKLIAKRTSRQQVISETARAGTSLATGRVTCHLNIIAVPTKIDQFDVSIAVTFSYGLNWQRGFFFD